MEYVLKREAFGKPLIDQPVDIGSQRPELFLRASGLG
jgi:hypothetical protein